MEDRRNTGSVTKRLYDDDAYIKEFRARVIGCSPAGDKAFGIELDMTAFFPEGGGQKSDTGRIGDAVITDVQEKDGHILHISDRPLDTGAEYDCAIDFAKRYDRMQNHSAEHLLCGIIHNMTGYDNVGFHLSDDETILDINGPVSKEMLKEAEEKANKVIYENAPITAAFLSGDELKGIDYRSKLDITENVRIVTIEGYDKCACCAPHVKSTGEIGIIRIIDAMPHRGGVRITILAGERAYRDYVYLDESNRQYMAWLSTKRLEGAKGVEQIINKNRALSEDNVRLKKELTSIVLDNLKKKLENKNDDRPVPVFSANFDDVMMRNLINEGLKMTDAAIMGFTGDDDNGYKYIIGAKEDKGILYKGEYTDLPGFAKIMNGALNGRGGGSRLMIQGSLKALKNDIEEFFI